MCPKFYRGHENAINNSLYSENRQIINLIADQCFRVYIYTITASLAVFIIFYQCRFIFVIFIYVFVHTERQRRRRHDIYDFGKCNTSFISIPTLVRSIIIWGLTNYLLFSSVGSKNQRMDSQISTVWLSSFGQNGFRKSSIRKV